MTNLPTENAYRIARRAGQVAADEIRATILLMLSVQGWSTEIVWDKDRGIDLVASRDGQRWLITCTGTDLLHRGGAASVEAVGDMLGQMGEPEAKHSLACPELSRFRRLWADVPVALKRRFNATALFVAEGSTVEEVGE